jgi:aminopeptidase N
VVVAHHQGAGGLEAASRLAVALGLGETPVGMEDQFSVADLAQKDLILIGRPAARIWQPAKGDGFVFTANGFTLKGHDFDGPGLSFFGVFKRRGSQGRSVALFLPADATLAKTIGVKVPHYGKYSYLVFDGPRNRVKGTWDAATSPLTLRWAE